MSASGSASLCLWASPVPSPACDPCSVWEAVPDSAQEAVLFTSGIHTRQSPEECMLGTRAGPGCPTSLPHPCLDGDWRRVFLLKEFIVPELRLLTVI